MPKDHIQVQCPSCRAMTLIAWPTSRKRGAQVDCPSCNATFHAAAAVEQTVLGKRGGPYPHMVPESEPVPDEGAAASRDAPKGKRTDK